MIFGIAIDRADGIVSAFKRFPVFIARDQFAVLGHDFIPLLVDALQVAFNGFTFFQPLHVTFNIPKGDLGRIDPAAFMMEPATAAGNKKPWILGFLIGFQPFYPIGDLAELLDFFLGRLAALQNPGHVR